MVVQTCFAERLQEFANEKEERAREFEADVAPSAS